jgi:hypothetical protein
LVLSLTCPFIIARKSRASLPVMPQSSELQNQSSESVQRVTVRFPVFPLVRSGGDLCPSSSLIGVPCPDLARLSLCFGWISPLSCEF